MKYQIEALKGIKVSDVLLMCFDLETTGVNITTDRVVQIAVSYFNRGSRVQQHQQLINPERPIPVGASEVHGVYDADVLNAPTMGQFAPRLLPHFTGRIFTDKSPPIIVGYNVLGYDIPLFQAELERVQATFRVDDLPAIDLLLWVRWFLRHEPKQKLTEICDRFNVTLNNAHEALADARACGHLINAFLDSGYLPDDLGQTLEFQSVIRDRLDEEYRRYKRWIYLDREDERTLRIGQGKHIGMTLDAVDDGYFKFILRKIDDLPQEVKSLFERRLNPS